MSVVPRLATAFAFAAVFFFAIVLTLSKNVLLSVTLTRTD
jgi:hypothetical protein